MYMMFIIEMIIVLNKESIQRMLVLLSGLMTLQSI